jgi:formylglycine-generating enzyme required for sulfatase activity
MFVMFLFISSIACGTGTGLTVKGATYKTSSVSGGSFMMGCVLGDGDCSDSESPRHEVTISDDMEVMTTEVTQGLYKSVMGSNPSSFSSCGSDCPVEQVSWVDAIVFSNALNGELGLDVCYTKTGEDVSWSALDCNGWRLPTEAEWEYLARGGEEHLYSGSNNVGDVAWYRDNSGSETHPVGQKAANAFGLYDMSGNVWELTWDRHDGDFYSSASVTNPRGPSNTDTFSGSFRVGRGGGWADTAGYARSSYRYSYFPSNGFSTLGFRFLRKK